MTEADFVVGHPDDRLRSLTIVTLVGLNIDRIHFRLSSLLRWSNQAEAAIPLV